MSISEETISRVREAADIVEVVGEYVPNLKRAGKDFKAACPFHQERTPSFMVSPAKGIFHCFGCGIGGDVFKFVMEIERLSYPEAIEKLAERRGIPVQRTGGGRGAGDGRQKRPLLEVLARAAQFYHKRLLESKDGREAREYCARQRALSEETIAKFRLGWAPAGGRSLVEVALKSGVQEADLIRAGLAVRSSKDQRLYDWFRGRVLFPITDVKGQVIAFGGRILEAPLRPGENPPPKYLNSAETEVFQKGRNLYGFYQAGRALREKDEALVLEGYMDVIACHQAGIENAVAPLGTSLTAEQGQVLKRFVQRVTLLFDSDSAGESAALRGSEVLLEQGFVPMVAKLPGAKDADEYLKRHTRAQFEDCLSRKQSVVEFKLEALLARAGGAAALDAKIAAVRSVLPLLLKVGDEIARSELLKAISEKMRISWQPLLNEWSKVQEKGLKAPVRAAGARRAPVPGQAAASPPQKRKLFLSAEEELLGLACGDPDLRAKLMQARTEEGMFQDRRVLECLERMERRPRTDKPADLLADLSEETALWFSGLLARVGALDPGGRGREIFDSILERLRRKREEERLKGLAAEAAEVLNRGEAGAEAVQRFRKLAPSVKGSAKNE